MLQVRTLTEHPARKNTTQAHLFHISIRKREESPPIFITFLLWTKKIMKTMEREKNHDNKRISGAILTGAPCLQQPWITQFQNLQTTRNPSNNFNMLPQSIERAANLHTQCNNIFRSIH